MKLTGIQRNGSGPGTCFLEVVLAEGRRIEVRRDFDAETLARSVKLNPRDQTSIRIVAQMDVLFAIDERARKENLNPSDRHLLRLEKAKPLLEQIKTAIHAARGDALPKSALAKACN